VGQGAVEVGGAPVDDLDALIEPPTGPVHLRTSRGSRPVRPADAHTVRRWLRRKAGWSRGDAGDWSDAKRPDGSGVTQGLLRQVTLLLGNALVEGPGRGIDRRRSRVLSFVFGVTSPRLLLEREAGALIAWLQSDAHGEPNNTATEECQRMLGRAIAGEVI
jgi:hypothetical protein